LSTPHDVRLRWIERLGRLPRRCRKEPSGSSGHAGIHACPEVLAGPDIERDAHAIAAGARSEQFQLGKRELLGVKTDEAKRYVHRQRLRCLRVKEQAGGRLPGLQGTNEVGSVGVEERCGRYFNGCILGCRPVQQAGVDFSRSATDEHRFFASRPDVVKGAEGSRGILHALILAEV
jgi:hypothetical protein